MPPNNHETDHLVAAILGEESPDHPRQRAIRWIVTRSVAERVQEFNFYYAQVDATIRACFPHDAVRRAAIKLFGSPAAVQALLTDRPYRGGQAGAGTPGAGASQADAFRPEDQPALHPGLGS